MKIRKIIRNLFIVLVILSIILFSCLKINEFANSNKIVLKNILAVDQHPDYPTGCESVALYILLKYYNLDVTVEDIIEILPKGPLPYYVGNTRYGANPEKEFVGNPTDSNSYGVYNGPIAQTANQFKTGALSKTGASIEEIKNIINTGNPVIAWVNIDFKYSFLTFSGPWYDYETLETIYWPRGEHAVVVYGYDEKNFYISNPYNGKKEIISQENFNHAYYDLNERIVYYNENE